LLRAGMVALTGDRVTLIVDVTGETRTEPAPFDDRPGTALSHLVIWLPSGARLGDFWLPGDRMRVNGRIYRLSPSLNGMGLPNLYQFLSVASFAAGPGSAEEHAIVDLPFPSDGPLGVDSRWRKIQAAILSGWENGSTDGSFLALRTVPNASSFYPLVDGQGRAIRKTFLLVLPPSGNATSRGSSPLEKNVPESF